jgi:hypothetical protein
MTIVCLHGLYVSVMVGFKLQEDAKWFRRREGGIVLTTQDMLIAGAAKLG